MSFDEVTEKPGFWILGGVGTAMVILGWIWAKKMEWPLIPIWQMAVTIVAIWIASVFFAAKD